MTTDAVLCPTPGNVSNCSMVSGTTPLKCSTSIVAIPWSLLDLPGANPTGRIIRRISSSPKATIFAGVGARRKSSFVT
jgi:hypothetical protein